jgi:DNA repair/transcription protein MET18/MMS19
MDTLFSRKRPVLKAMGERFVKGYIELVEGEKDPRNLVYIFAMDRVILVEWEMDKETIEAFFDVTYCYFPITFRPPPDDPYGISTNTLRLALRRALTASPLLAPHAMPLLIEKLQASGGNAKRDALETLEEVLPVFGRSAALAHIKELWEGFKIEIMHATDDATSICSTKALESLLYVLYVGEKEASGVATEMVADMLDELEEPAKQQAKSASTILAAMIRATPASASLATHASVDQLLTMYKEPEEPSIRGSILGHLTSIVKALRETYDGSNKADPGVKEEAVAKEEGRFTFEKPASVTTPANKRIVDGDVQRTYEGDGRPLDKFRDLLLGTLSHGLKTSATRVAAVELFVNLSHIEFLGPQEMRHICDSVNELLVDANGEQVRVQTLEALRDLGNKRVVEESTLPLLFGLLPDRILASDDQEEVKGNIRRSLGSLARLCDSTDFFDMLIVKLSTKFDLVCVSDVELEANVGYARGLINTMRVVLEEKMERKDRDTARYGSLVPRLIGNIVEASVRSSAHNTTVAGNRKVIRDVGTLVTLLVRCLDGTKQKELAVGLYPLLLHGDLGYLHRHSSLLSRSLPQPLTLKVQLLSSDASQTQRDVLYPVASALVALKKEISGLQEDMTGNLSQVLEWTLASKSLLQEQAGSVLLANGINKHIPEPSPDSFQAMVDNLWKAEIDNNDKMQVDGVDGESGGKATLLRHRRAVRIWLVIARALLVRNSATGQQMIERVLSLLSRASNIPASVIKEAAKGLGKITSQDDVLCKENGSVIRLLYKQRFVTFILPKLLEGFQRSRTNGAASSSSTSSIHLIAICSLLPSLPKATLLEKLKEIFPLLIMALDLDEDEADESIKSSAANVITLATAIGKREKDEAISIANANIVAAGGHDVGEGVIASNKKNSLDLVKDHIASILTRLLAILVTKTSEAGQSGSQEAAKISALRCLAMLARSVDYPTLHPHKTRVLKVLGQKGAGVDDSKRNIRLEAVDARDAWYALKGAGEDE